MRARLDSIARVWAAATVVGWMVFLAVAIGTVSNVQAAVTPTQPPPELEQRRDAPQTTVEHVSATVMCPSCDTTLDQSESPAAERMRAWVVAAVDAGWTEREIREGLVAEYGGDESVLAVPRAQGVGLAVWIVPALIALASLAGGVAMLRRWRRDPLPRAPQTRSTSSSGSHASSSATSQSAPASPAVSSPPSSR